MKELTAFIIAFLWCASTAAQLTLQRVYGLPSRQVYDLHFDQKGYLWIAHDLGISRYDGSAYRHYRHKDAVTLKMTDILEDKQGRIWFHNLSGQIFYIEHNQMKLLDSYNYEKESQYPRMVISGDQLLITSNRGLFICHTATLSTQYVIKKEAQGTGVESITDLGSSALMLNNNQFYLYQRDQPLQPIRPPESIFLSPEGENILQPYTAGDTIFLVTNPAGIVYKMLLKDQQLLHVGQKEMQDYVMNVTTGNTTWIHSRNKSVTIDGQQMLRGYQITDVEYDSNGRPWFSSRQNGLLTTAPSNYSQIIQPFKGGEDHIRSINLAAGYFFYGTQRGNLYKQKNDSGRIDWEYRLFDGYGSIDFIRYYRDNWFVVGASLNTYLVNPEKQEVRELLHSKSITDVDFHANTIYIAASDGLYLIPFLEDGGSTEQWKNEAAATLPFHSFTGTHAFQLSHTRARAVRYEKQTGTLFVSFKNGLHTVTKDGIRPFIINNKMVHATSLWYKHPYLFIATLNDGLWVKNGHHLTHLTTSNYLLSNHLLRIKATEKHLWLFEQDAMQLYDLRTHRILYDINLPPLNGPDVMDVAELNGYGYLATDEGLYKIPLEDAISKTAPIGYVDYLIINNKDTVLNGNVRLPHHRNDVQFFLSSPNFQNPQDIIFKYRLAGADEEWRLTEIGERMIRYAALPPGDYTFEAYALEKSGLQQQVMIKFPFTIAKPWWKTNWFILLSTTALGLLIYFMYRFRLRQILKVEMVRQQIARDLHDDIGATMSSINVYTALTRKTLGDSKYLSLIQQHTTDIVTKLDDLVWSINPRYDSVDELIKRMKIFAEPLLDAAGISNEWSISTEVLHLHLPVHTKRQFYLIFKEVTNNMVKHSRSTQCLIRISLDKGQLKLDIFDDGVALPAALNDSGNGINNMKARVQSLNGTVQVLSSSNTENHFQITIPVK